MTDVAPTLREVSPELVATLLGWLELVCGRRALDELVSRHDRGDAAELSRADRWMSRAEFEDLVAIAQDIAGDDRIGRDVGLVSYRASLGTPSETSIRDLGNVTEAMKVMASYSSKMTVGRVLTIEETDRGRAVLVGRYVAGVRPTQFNCDLTAGYFAALPSLFDRLGYAIETRCQGRGDDHCRYELRWTLDPRAVDPSRRVGAGISVRGISKVEQTEHHHAAAAELVRAQSVTDVLERIVVQVASAIQAPGFVLAVRPDGPKGPLRVHSHGVEAAVAEKLSDLTTAKDAKSSIVAPILKDRDELGHLVAVLPPGTEPSAQDQRLLSSYAGYAASALAIVNSLEEARHARDTATALLGFSRALSRATSAQDVCDLLGRSVADLIDCRFASVWLHDPDRGMVLASGHDSSGLPYVPETSSLLPSERPVLQTLIEDHQPRLLQADEIPEGSRDEIDVAGISHVMLLPLVSGDELFGLVTAAYETPPPEARHDTLLDQAAAIADQAAVALSNARLTEQLRHQAVHDELTGLPQRVLAQDRCARALAMRARTGETVAVLFVDLDGFKEINDNLGHAIGDDLLCAVARRLTNLLRASDTCARLGGDEFVIVLSGLISDEVATEISQRVVDAFDAPFVLDGDAPTSVSVTASVGVACATDDSDFEELLRRSDAAMYAAKRAGRHTYSLAD